METFEVEIANGPHEGQKVDWPEGSSGYRLLMSDGLFAVYKLKHIAMQFGRYTKPAVFYWGFFENIQG